MGTGTCSVLKKIHIYQSRAKYEGRYHVRSTREGNVFSLCVQQGGEGVGVTPVRLAAGRRGVYLSQACRLGG